MTKEEKAVVINNLAEQLNEYPHFYLTDIETLNAEQTAQLRRKCFENEIKLVVVKNTLFGKALEKAEKADADLMKVLEGSTSVMFATTAKAPAVVIKEFRKKSEKPVLRQRSWRSASMSATTSWMPCATLRARKNSSERSFRSCSRLRRMLSLHCKLMQAKRLRAS